MLKFTFKIYVYYMAAYSVYRYSFFPRVCRFHLIVFWQCSTKCSTSARMKYFTVYTTDFSSFRLVFPIHKQWLSCSLPFSIISLFASASGWISVFQSLLSWFRFQLQDLFVHSYFSFILATIFTFFSLFQFSLSSLHSLLYTLFLCNFLLEFFLSHHLLELFPFFCRNSFGPARLMVPVTYRVASIDS